jgi:hypothetical protein
MPDCVTQVFQVAPHDIENEGGHGMTHVRIVIDSHTANIHPDFSGFQCLEFFLFTGEGIVNPQHDHSPKFDKEYYKPEKSAWQLHPGRTKSAE